MAAPNSRDPEFDAAGPVTTTSGLVAGSKMADDFGGGIVYIVSGLKTFVETGAPMAAAAAS